MRQKITPYLFIFPFFALFFTFLLGPALYALYAGFTKWQGLAPPVMIGLQNYVYLLKDKTFILSLTNTITYSLIGMIIVVPLALLLASLLNVDWLKKKGFFRAIYFLPVITPAVVIGIIFALVYDQDYGLINWVLAQVGLPAIEWMTAKWFKTAVAGMIIWRWSGYHMIYFLAGLQGIRRDLYEAAKVDGASMRQRFRYITIPSLRPTIIFVVVMMTISAWQIFDEPYMLLNDGRGFGGPSDSGLSIAMYLYRSGFRFARRGYGSAIGSVLFAIMFTLSLVWIKYLGLFRED